jgi:hypothetical protein
VFQFFDLGFKFGDRLLEIEEIHCHRGARIKGTDLFFERNPPVDPASPTEK